MRALSQWLCVVLITWCSQITSAEPSSGLQKSSAAETRKSTRAGESSIADPQRSQLDRSAPGRLDDFYRPDEVQTVFLHVSAANLKLMKAALPRRIYVPATFRWRDFSFENIAIRFKGNSSSRPKQPHKRGFLIKFNEYDEDLRFLGLRRVSLDNGVQFGSLFSEPIITEILHDQGIKTHRCNYARLYLNDEYKGIYTNVERIDQSFIAHHLSDSNGALFKVDLGGPGANLQFLGDDVSAYQRAFEPKTRRAKDEPQRLVDLLRWIDKSSSGDVEASLASKLELDDFLGVTAVMLLSGAFDQLTGWQPHNYYLYRDPDHGRWRYLPWDLDVGFCEIAFGRIYVLADWNAAWPVPAGGPPSPLLERIVADPRLLQKYRDLARLILEKYFEPARLCEQLDAKYALIKDDLQSDPFPHRRATNPADQSYDDIVASMKSFVRKRYATARQQLEDPGPRPEPPRRPPHSRAGNHAGPPPQLVKKIQRVQRLAEQMMRSGKDVSPIRKRMQQVGPLLQQGNVEEAEKRIDEALKLAGDFAGQPSRQLPPED